MSGRFGTKPPRALFLSDLGPGPPADRVLSGPQRFARAFADAAASKFDLSVVNISEGNKLSRSLACLGRYDIYHVSGVSFLEPVLAGLRAGKRLVYTAHGIAIQERAMGYSYPARLIGAEGFLVRRSRAVVSVSDTLGARIAEEYPFARTRIRVIPPLVAPEITARKPEDPGFPRPYILFPGAGPTKGLAHALRAFDIVRRDAPELSLVVISDSRAPGLPGVVWSKPLATGLLVGAYLGAELIINTSDYESFGLPVAEAAALGKPFLVSRNSGVSEYASERFPDLVVDPSDHEALAGKIALILGNPPDPDSLVSWAQRFSAERVLGEYLELYREISAT